jgi:hypothetical protein
VAHVPRGPVSHLLGAPARRFLQVPLCPSRVVCVSCACRVRAVCVVCVSCANDCVRRYRAIFSEIEMPWNWPADVNQLEAKAYCSWKGEGFRYFAHSLLVFIYLFIMFFFSFSFRFRSFLFSFSS